MLRRVGIAQAIVNDPELLLVGRANRLGSTAEQRVQFRGAARIGRDGHSGREHATWSKTSGPLAPRWRSSTGGFIVCSGGTPDELTARGVGHGVGDAPLERGYSAALPRGGP